MAAIKMTLDDSEMREAAVMYFAARGWTASGVRFDTIGGGDDSGSEIEATAEVVAIVPAKRARKARAK